MKRKTCNQSNFLEFQRNLESRWFQRNFNLGSKLGFGPSWGMPLINACVMYDKTKKAHIGKRRNVYSTNIDETYIDPPTACIDHVPDSPYGGIDLPPGEFYQVHALSSSHPPYQRPGQPSRPPFRPQSQHSGPTKPIRRYDGPIFLPPQIYTQPNSLVSLKPNSIRHLIMLRKYIHHLVQDSHISVSSDATDHALEPDNFLHTTFHQFMSWKLNEITTSSPSPPPSVTASDPRAAPSTPSCSTQLLNFNRGIKRDISAYPTLKDEKYYESFKRSVLVTARAHDCEEILQPTFRPRGDADSLELFRLKNDFMYSVFNKCLLSDMGKTIVRKHLDNMNAQRVWEEFATHMTTSSKGKAEKRRLHTYVTTTVLDKSWKGTTEQFILHFNEQFRQLDEVSPPEESLPYTTRLTLLQTAVHNIPELRIVETMEEFISLSSSTPGPTMGYDNYLTLLQNACIRYDSTHTSKPSPASRAAYQHELSPDQHDNPYTPDYSSSGTTYGGIDMPAEEFYQVHTTNLNRPPNVSTLTPWKPTPSPPIGRPTPRRSPGPIFLPANIYKLLSDVAIKELKKNNATTRSTPPPKRAVNTHVVEF